MTSDAFGDVARRYAYVLRSDVDALLMPGLRSWVPEHGSAVGRGYSGEPYTEARLKTIAKDLGLKHHGIHNMQSTFYIASTKAVAFSRMLVNLTQYFFDHEFTAERCAEVVRQGGACKWPEWYRQVSSLYATDLAANHLLGEPYFDATQVTDRMDHCATGCWSWDLHSHGALNATTRAARDIAQVHLLSAKGLLYDQFLIAHDLNEFCSKIGKAWPNFVVRSFPDWATPQESVYSFFHRVIARSVPRMCSASAPTLHESQPFLGSRSV
mmetsp:Transcript_63809/g.180072  ORF Transcript_63809/g.180072 Transcript_63809/m.180072 type:complete len:268 (-) Transcript_63809:49-852(-)